MFGTASHDPAKSCIESHPSGVSAQNRYCIHWACSAHWSMHLEGMNIQESLGGGDGVWISNTRGPQSAQSDPRGQDEYSESRPPSSQSRSSLKSHEFSHTKHGAYCAHSELHSFGAVSQYAPSDTGGQSSMPSRTQKSCFIHGAYGLHLSTHCFEMVEQNSMR